MEEDHYSKEWDDAPMPHSIFFTKRGHAIHGTDSVNRLGNPASHGCVRLSRANAATLFELVRAEGVLNTTVTLTGSSQVALMRGPQRRNDVAARTASPQAEEPRMYDGNARTLPPPQQITPHVTDTGGYYDEYGRWVSGGGRSYRRSTEAQSPYAGHSSPMRSSRRDTMASSRISSRATIISSSSPTSSRMPASTAIRTTRSRAPTISRNTRITGIEGGIARPARACM